jgi:hypothetical protein
LAVKRALDPALRLRLKAATRLAVQDCGGLHEAHLVTGLSTSQLSRCQAAGNGDLIGLPALVLMAEHSGTRGFAEFFADLAGCSLRSEEPADPAGAIQAGAAALSEACELAHVIGQALADGKLTPKEQADIRRVAGDAREAMSVLERAMTGETKKRGRS